MDIMSCNMGMWLASQKLTLLNGLSYKWATLSRGDLGNIQISYNCSRSADLRGDPLSGKVAFMEIWPKGPPALVSEGKQGNAPPQHMPLMND